MTANSPPSGRLRRVREAQPWADHLWRAFARYFNDSSDRLAASITYYGYLSLFPLLLLVASVAGLVLRGSPEKQQRLLENVAAYVPGDLVGQLVKILTTHAGTTGVLGLIGLALAGLGWLDALRESIRSVWHQAPVSGSILRKKAKDLVILAGLGLTVAASIAITTLGTSLARYGLAFFGLDDAAAAATLLRVVAFVLAVTADVALFAYLFLWLPRLTEPLRRVLGGSVFGAVGFELIKILGVAYIDAVTSAGAELYGASLATGFGLLIWINIVSRFVLFAAAWTVTAPYRPDVEPSGSAAVAEPADERPPATGAAPMPAGGVAMR